MDASIVMRNNDVFPHNDSSEVRLHGSQYYEQQVEDISNQRIFAFKNC